MSKLSEAQREALVRLAQSWCRGRAQPCDALRPQTREALRRAGLADGGILPKGLCRIGLNGSAVIAWEKQMRVAAQASRARDEHVWKWFRDMPMRTCDMGRIGAVTAATLREAADALAPLEAAHVAACAEALRLQEAARGEVRAALGVDDE